MVVVVVVDDLRLFVVVVLGAVVDVVVLDGSRRARRGGARRRTRRGRGRAGSRSGSSRRGRCRTGRRRREDGGPVGDQFHRRHEPERQEEDDGCRACKRLPGEPPPRRVVLRARGGGDARAAGDAHDAGTLQDGGRRQRNRRRLGCSGRRVALDIRGRDLHTLRGVRRHGRRSIAVVSAPTAPTTSVGSGSFGPPSTEDVVPPAAPVPPTRRSSVEAGPSGTRTTACLTASCPRSIDCDTNAVPRVAAIEPIATPTIVPVTPKLDAMSAAITAPAAEARICRKENFTPGEITPTKLHRRGLARWPWR